VAVLVKSPSGDADTNTGVIRSTPQPPSPNRQGGVLTACCTMSRLTRLHSVKPVTIMPVSPEKDIEKALESLELPYLRSDPVSAGVVAGISVTDDRAQIDLRFGFPVDSCRGEITDLVQEGLGGVAGDNPDIGVRSKIVAHEVQATLTPIEGVKNIIAIASGKGGVGKSTVTVNLALALAAAGAKVGVLDADIYGPSQARMLGSDGEQPVSKDGKRFEPLTRHGVFMISAGNLFADEQPAVWRGPMATRALTQLALETNWPDLDYLLVDMPPGTGDIQLTLSQKIPVAGAIIVTTPQDIALIDARKGYRMFEKVNVPVLGVVENMSTFVCPACGEVTALFGEGGGAEMAADYELPLLGQVPLNADIRAQTDSGSPSVVADPDGPAAREFTNIALNAAALLSLRKKDYKKAFPKVVVE